MVPLKYESIENHQFILFLIKILMIFNNNVKIKIFFKR